MDPALQQQLLGIFDNYNKALVAGKVTYAVNLRSAEARASVQRELPTEAARQRFLAMARTMLPDTVEAEHASINKGGDKASISMLATKIIPKNAKPPPGAATPGSTIRSEVTLSFVKERDGWELGALMLGGDPTTIAACKNDRFEPETAYDTNKTVSMGGPIRRVDFQPDYTLVVIRITDEENCAFLTDNKDGLMKHGLDPAKLVPYAVVEIEGSPHKTDKQKVLVDKLDVQPED